MYITRHTVGIGGEFIAPGAVIDLPDEVAAELLERGAVERVDPQSKPGKPGRNRGK
jgi:hypothetical protein